MTTSYEALNLGLLAPATALPTHIKGTMLSEASLCTIETGEITIAVQQYNTATCSFIWKSFTCNHPFELLTNTDNGLWLLQAIKEGDKLNTNNLQHTGELVKNQLLISPLMHNSYTTAIHKPGNYTIVEILLSEMFINEFKTLFPALNNELLAQTVWLDAELHQSIQSIFRARLSGSLLNFFMEARIKDIIFHACNKLLATSANHFQIEEYEITAVNKAAEIITTDITKHISIPELSKLVQLNDFKLKKYFRQIHGKSMYEFLVHHRMQKAKELLGQNLSVKQVAAIVGYRPSDFTVVFMQYFGINPSEIRNTKK